MTPEDGGKWIAGAGAGIYGVVKAITLLGRKRRPLSIAGSDESVSESWAQRMEGKVRDLQREQTALNDRLDAQAALYAERTRGVERIEARLLADAGKLDHITERIDRLFEWRQASR